MEEFRRKISFGENCSFKELENKFHIITSGIMHNQLCEKCVLNFSRMETKGVGKEGSNRMVEKVEKKGVGKLNYHKQYSWGY